MSFLTIFEQLTPGMWRSMLIFFLTLLLSLPLGLAVAFGRMSKCTPWRWLIKAYISIMRGTPLMLQLMVVYYGPFYIFGVSIWSGYKFYAVIIAFVVNYAAYFAEIYRGGIESIAVGQYEAAEVLGYTKNQTFFRIILPQVIKRILPSITNEIITLIKDTSLSFVITYMEMFTTARQIAASQSSVLPFVGAAVFYYVFNLIVAVLMEKAEKRAAYFE